MPEQMTTQVLACEIAMGPLTIKTEASLEHVA